MFDSAADIVEVLQEEVDPDFLMASLFAPYNLAWQGCRKRKANRPDEPTDLNFEISEDHIAYR